MAIATLEQKSNILTYDQYIDEFEHEPVVTLPSEIIDGVRHYMTSPNAPHQTVSRRLTRILEAYIDKHGGDLYYAPMDVMIRKSPLRIRQPDLFYITEERLDERGEVPSTGALEYPPNLAIEILSPTETRRHITAKLEDFARIGIPECWVVSPEAEDVAVLQLVDGAYQTVTICGVGQVLKSVTLENFSCRVVDMFTDRPRRKKN